SRDVYREEIVAARLAAVLDHHGEVVRRAVALSLDGSPERGPLPRQRGIGRARADRIDHQRIDAHAVIRRGRLRRLVVVFELALDGAGWRIGLYVEAEIRRARGVDDVDLTAAGYFAFRQLTRADARLTGIVHGALVEVVASGAVGYVDICRTRAGGSGATLGRVALAGGSATHSGRWREQIRWAQRRQTRTAFGYVADTVRRATDGGARSERIDRTNAARSVAGFGDVADAG